MTREEVEVGAAQGHRLDLGLAVDVEQPPGGDHVHRTATSWLVSVWLRRNHRPMMGG
jgi:hypothetical protein